MKTEEGDVSGKTGGTLGIARMKHQDLQYVAPKAGQSPPDSHSTVRLTLKGLTATVTFFGLAGLLLWAYIEAEYRAFSFPQTGLIIVVLLWCGFVGWMCVRVLEK